MIRWLARHHVDAGQGFCAGGVLGSLAAIALTWGDWVTVIFAVMSALWAANCLMTTRRARRLEETAGHYRYTLEAVLRARQSRGLIVEEHLQ